MSKSKHSGGMSNLHKMFHFEVCKCNRGTAEQAQNTS